MRRTFRAFLELADLAGEGITLRWYRRTGATVIALCTSHERAKIENCGAHFLVENMDDVRCELVEVDGQLKLKFTVAEQRCGV